MKLRVTTVEHGTFDKPYQAPDGLNCIIQLPFYLTEADYVVLKGRPGQFSTWASKVLASSVALVILLCAKWLLAKAQNQPFEVSVLDAWVIALTLAIGVILALINRFVDERAPLMKKISTHFKANPPTIGTVHRDV